jgi:hypothetical protein
MSQFRSKSEARKAASERAAQWRLALSQGRVVRTADGMQFQTFNTAAEAEAYAAANPFTHVVKDFR